MEFLTLLTHDCKVSKQIATTTKTIIARTKLWCVWLNTINHKHKIYACYVQCLTYLLFMRCVYSTKRKKENIFTIHASFGAR